MDRTRTPRKTLKLIFKEEKPMGQPRTRWFSLALEGVKKRGKSWIENGDEKL
jgi:hypothetical protein